MQKSDDFRIPRLIPAHGFISAQDACTLTPRDHDLIRDLRYVMHENQTQFWRRFGVTQTQGSRFERGKSIPLPVLLLIRLYLLHIVGDEDLQLVSAPQFDDAGASANANPASRSGPVGSP